MEPRYLVGDVLEELSALPDKRFDCIVTSPPYNLRNSSGGGLKNGSGGKWEKAQLLHGYANHEDAMPESEYIAWQNSCLTEMFRVLTDDGVIFYNHKWRVQKGLIQDRRQILEGLPVRQIIIWRRKGGFNFNAGYFLPTYEVIYMIAKKGFRLRNKANAHGDIWDIPQARGVDHPAPFPVELAERCISSTCAASVLDPFMGSGSTALASEKLGITDWVGIDHSAQYRDLAVARLQEQRCNG